MSELAFYEKAYCPSSAKPTADWSGSLKRIKSALDICINSEASINGMIRADLLERSGLTTNKLVGLIKRKPGYQAYIVNPYPLHEVLFENHWVRTEALLPGFLELTKPLRQAMGCGDVHLLMSRQQLMCAGEVIVGSKNFLLTFRSFLLDIEQKYLTLTGNELDQLFEMCFVSGKDLGNNESNRGVNLLLSTLLTEFLSRSSGQFKTLKLQQQLKLNDTQIDIKLLAEMREAIAMTGQLNQYRYWQGYRNLYISKLMSKRSHQQFLATVKAFQPNNTNGILPSIQA